MLSMNIYGLKEGYREDIITPILQMKQIQRLNDFPNFSKLVGRRVRINEAFPNPLYLRASVERAAQCQVPSGPPYVLFVHRCLIKMSWPLA